MCAELDVMEEVISHTKQVYYIRIQEDDIKFRQSFNMAIIGTSLSLQKGAATSYVNSGPTTEA
jgi:hypothetical protein